PGMAAMPTPPQPKPAPPQPAPAPSKPAFGGAAAPQRGPSSIELAPGTIFASRYRIEKQLGKGGMGAVYLATQELLNRRIAIKLLHMSSDEVTAARFQREARVIAQCQHPHIVNLIDFGEDDGRLFLVMEFIDGQSLTKLIEKEAPFTARRVCDIGIQIAEALAVAHEINVVHRDLKPDNIMVQTTTSSRDFVKILDFGVAKIKRDPGEGQVNTVETKAGLIVGSLRYISPEQVESGEITTRTDMYSFGCVLFEMLARRRVFDYPSPADCAIAHLTEQPKPPVVDGRVLEGPLVDFIMRCLQKKPENRPANGRAAAEALLACRDAPLKAAVPSSESPTIAMADVAAMDALQGNKTIATNAPPRPSTVTAMGAQPVAAPAAPAPQPVAAAPAPARASGPTSSCGRRVRPGPPASTSSAAARSCTPRPSMDGVRLQPRLVSPASGSKAWLWAVIVIVVPGGATAALFVVKPWESSATAPPPVTATREAAADAGPAADAAAAAADDVAPDSRRRRRRHRRGTARDRAERRRGDRERRRRGRRRRGFGRGGRREVAGRRDRPSRSAPPSRSPARSSARRRTPSTGIRASRRRSCGCRSRATSTSTSSW
ncbi:MAG: serine/threonine-protein kinase, partial [Myxococcota bacterium]